MTELRAAVEDYLAIRRQLGFVLERDGRLLPDFVGYLEGAGAARVTTELAVAWATLPAAHPAWWRARLGIVRGFARHLKTIDPATEIPSGDLLRARRPRVRPYLYSDADIAALMEAARELRPQWRAATYETLVGLLAVTGLRLGEALGLDRPDVELAGAVLVVRRAKLGKVREVPLHETTVEALRRYCRVRDRRWPSPATPSFFVAHRGDRLGAATVHDNFAELVRRASLEGRGERCRPRPHDLRHSFAVRTLLGWYRAGADVEASLPLLSTWLGHVDPAATYWYFEAAPELLAVAAQRLEHVLRPRS